MGHGTLPSVSYISSGAVLAGKIGGLRYREMLDLQLPCLLTPAQPSATRTTVATVEALSLDPADSPRHTYYGINQARANT